MLLMETKDRRKGKDNRGALVAVKTSPSQGMKYASGRWLVQETAKGSCA
jgi:hypothetical protein